ncbi:Putative RING-H2 finger protein ATL71 [Apostasia shenzhenica]|uniref:RING-H2 finger protein ATL71 n=1 Tax=Apostasia shenzhenica TaxID=1088818 RepID=A0A2I0A6V3_9ASPA|nr:Putative RING-H2 finger protein ATL71 [Apostasia shenzhenica]
MPSQLLSLPPLPPLLIPMNGGGGSLLFPTNPASSAAENSPDAVLSSGKISKFGYGLGISIGILLLISTITFMSYFCARSDYRRRRPRRGPNHEGAGNGGGASVDVEGGVDEAILKSWPEITYAEAKGRDPRATGGGCCSVCLVDYGEGDLVRQLPECGHVFHVGCVDPWLRRRPTCPVCRSSPAPSPMATPLAEVAPLAAMR